MTPDELPLPPFKRDQLQGAMASAGIMDGLQVCIDESAATVADHVLGYTFSSLRTNGWITALALLAAYTRAAMGVPEPIKDAAAVARKELEAVRDGKFPGAISTTAPARSAGVAITSASDLDDSLR